MRVIGIVEEGSTSDYSTTVRHVLSQMCSTLVGLKPNDRLPHKILSSCESGDIVIVSLGINRSHQSNEEFEYSFDNEVKKFQIELRQRDIQIIQIKHNAKQFSEYIDAISITVERPFMASSGRGEDFLRNKLESLINGLTLLDLVKINEIYLLEIVHAILREYKFKPYSMKSSFLFERYDGMYTFTTRDPFDKQYEERWLIEVRNDNELTDSRAINRLMSSVYASKQPVNILYFTTGVMNSRLNAMLDDVREEIRQKLRIVDRYEIKQLIAQKPKLIKLIKNR